MAELTEVARRPLGVFDSGLGGLTVVRALRARLPAEDIVYLGDTARVPYGTKGPDTVVRYAEACTDFLVQLGVKGVVIACNTVSAVAPPTLRERFDVPVMAVIEPGAEAAVRATRTGRIAVLATAGTVASGAYPRAIKQRMANAEVHAKSAPLLVPLAEEGWTEGQVPDLVVRAYMNDLKDTEVDTIILGCTHYPLLRAVIEQAARDILGSHVRVIDSAEAVTDHVLAELGKRGLLHPDAERTGNTELNVTDLPASFGRVAERFLGAGLGNVRQVDL